MKYKGLESTRVIDLGLKNSYITINTEKAEKYPTGNHKIVSLFWKGEQIFRDVRGYASVHWYEL